MTLTATENQRLNSLTETYYRFGDIITAAESFRSKNIHRSPYAGRIGKIILNRHVVSVVRDRALAYGFHDNAVVAGALTILKLPHAESETGDFNAKVHPELYGAFKGVRANRSSQGEEYAAKILVKAVDSLTPDTRDDYERHTIASELLQAAGVSIRLCRSSDLNRAASSAQHP